MAADTLIPRQSFRRFPIHLPKSMKMQNDFSATLGGPILHNKLFFFFVNLDCNHSNSD